MNVKVEKKENNMIKLQITVPAEQFNEAIKKAYSKNVKKFNIPGFRKGKAPMHIIEKMYGEGVFFEDAINICCDATYPVAIKENNIKPIDYPAIDVLEIGKGKELVYTAEVAVEPEVELGNYKGVEVEKVTYDVTDEEVDNKIAAAQKSNATVEEKTEGTVENGDIVVVDFKGFVDGEAFEGGEAADFELEIGSGTFIDTFEEQLVGAKVGEEKEVNVTFPAEYGREELNSKPATFKVTVKAIKAKNLPELNDEFAKSVSDAETFEAYKAEIRKNLEEANIVREKREFEEAVLNKVCEAAKVEIPEVMIERETDNMLKDLEMKLQYQGLDLQTYYAYTNNTEEKVREYMKETAAKRVLNDLVLNKIAEVEEIEVADEEILERAKEYATQYGQDDVEKLAASLVQMQGRMIASDLKIQKVVELLVENSKAI